jgi:hypothetical protein
MLRYASSNICMWTRLMDLITGSRRPRHDKVSFMDSQNGNEFSVWGTRAGKIEVVGGVSIDTD